MSFAIFIHEDGVCELFRQNIIKNRYVIIPGEGTIQDNYIHLSVCQKSISGLCWTMTPYWSNVRVESLNSPLTIYSILDAFETSY